MGYSVLSAKGAQHRYRKGYLMSALPAAAAAVLPVAPGAPGAPVYFASSQSYRVRKFVVYVPQADRRYVGSVPVSRHNTAAEAEAAVAALLAAGNYELDAFGWWRPVA